MLASIKDKTPLYYWKAGDKGDLGVMLLEMWAYVCHSLSFYDEVIANESYLRTCSLISSRHKHVNLFGYLPTPAVAAEVLLIALAEGKDGVNVPMRTAFRSSAFDNEAPQVFETVNRIPIHPLYNKMDVRPNYVDSNEERELNDLVLIPKTEIRQNDLLFIRGVTKNSLVKVRSTESVIDRQDQKALKIHFEETIKLSDPKLAEIDLIVSSTVAAIEKIKSRNKELILDSLYPDIRPGNFAFLTKESEYRWFEIREVDEVQFEFNKGTPIYINSIAYKMAGQTKSVTLLSLDDLTDDNEGKNKDLTWEKNDAGSINLYYHVESAGILTEEALPNLEPAEAVSLKGAVEKPEDIFIPERFVFEDKNETPVVINGKLDHNSITIDTPSKWETTLQLPVSAYGNVITASRGESVIGEVIGSGDASMANQSFTLKKKPLTYLQSSTNSNHHGFLSTLTIYVDGKVWQEVPSLFGMSFDQEVYMVRQDEDEESVITFGDGINGARLPTGIDNVIANYRYGAGVTCPPADSITQVAKPVKGLKSVRNPFAALGGRDREVSENMTENAGRYNFLFGRAVSIQDIEAVALRTSGVISIKAEWAWKSERQQPVVQLWYMGSADLEESIRTGLKSYTCPTTSISVNSATPIMLKMNIGLVSAGFDRELVKSRLLDVLIATQTGFLLPENIGIGKPLFRSTLLEKILSVEGVISVTYIKVIAKKVEGNDELAVTLIYKEPEIQKILVEDEEFDLLNSTIDGDCIFGIRPVENDMYLHFDDILIT